MSLEEADDDDDGDGDGQLALVKILIIPLTLRLFCPWNSPLPPYIIMSRSTASPSRRQRCFSAESRSHQRRLPSRG